MPTRRMLSLLFALFACSLTLFACLSSAWASETVRVAVYDNPPLVVLEEGRAPRGIFVELLELVAEKEGWKLEYQIGTWPQCLQMLETNLSDLIVAIAHSEQREKRYAFTDQTVISNWGVIHARRGLEVQSYIDLDGKTIALPRSDVYAGELKDLLRAFGVSCRFIEGDTYANVLRLVATRKADAGATSRFARPSQEFTEAIVGTPLVFAPVELRFAVLRTGKTHLLEAISKNLSNWKANGTSPYYDVIDRYLDSHAGRSPQWFVWLLTGAGIVLLAVGFVVVFFVARKEYKDGERRRGDRRVSDRRSAFSPEHDHRLIYDGFDDALLVFDGSKLVQTNIRGEEMFGYDAQELLGLSLEELCIGQPPEPTTEPQIALLTAKRKDGSTFDAEVNWHEGELGETRRVLCVLRNVTGRDGGDRDDGGRDVSGRDDGGHTSNELEGK